MMRNFLIQFIDIFTTLLIFAIFVRVIFSWMKVNMHGNALLRFLYEVTEPVLALFRRIIPPIGTIDISPLVAFLAIDFLRVIVIKLL